VRAKAIAERAVVQSTLDHTVFAPSIIYSPGDPYLALLARMSWLPVMPIPGSGRARFQPIWAQVVADCVLASLPGGFAGSASVGARYELAGPETLTHREIVEIALDSFHRRRTIVKVPIRVVRRVLKLAELLGGPTAFATCDEAELMEVSLLTAAGPRTRSGWGWSPGRWKPSSRHEQTRFVGNLPRRGDRAKLEPRFLATPVARSPLALRDCAAAIGHAGSACSLANDGGRSIR